MRWQQRRRQNDMLSGRVNEQSPLAQANLHRRSVVRAAVHVEQRTDHHRLRSRPRRQNKTTALLGRSYEQATTKDKGRRASSGGVSGDVRVRTAVAAAAVAAATRARVCVCVCACAFVGDGAKHGWHQGFNNLGRLGHTVSTKTTHTLAQGPPHGPRLYPQRALPGLTQRRSHRRPRRR